METYTSLQAGGFWVLFRCWSFLISFLSVFMCPPTFWLTRPAVHGRCCVSLNKRIIEKLNIVSYCKTLHVNKTLGCMSLHWAVCERHYNYFKHLEQRVYSICVVPILFVFCWKRQTVEIYKGTVNIERQNRVYIFIKMRAL